MVKTGDNELNVAPFLMKCYEMVDDPSTNSVISWSQSYDTFVIWNMTDFTRDLLPKFFKHQNFSSFMRQLNIYGFRKVDTDRWEFANEGFIKDQKHLLKNIKRRKHPQGASHKNHQQEQIVRASDEVDYRRLQKEVEILKTDKTALMQELAKLRERQESSQNKLLLLRERIQGMENNQQQLLSFLVMVMQNPSLLVQLLQPKENNWRVCDSGKITLNNDTEFGDPVFPDGVIVRYQPLPDDPSLPTPTKSSESQKTMEHDLPFDRVKDFFMNFDFPSSPLDENFLSPENCGSIMVPELDLAMIEQFLLSSPSRENGDDEGRVDDEEPIGLEMELEMEIETALAEKCQLERESVSLISGEGHSPSLEVVTEQMGVLSPGNGS